MKVKNFTGFVLGNENAIHKIGAPWMECDVHVWVCPNLTKAKKITSSFFILSILSFYVLKVNL